MWILPAAFYFLCYSDMRDILAAPIYARLSDADRETVVISYTFLFLGRLQSAVCLHRPSSPSVFFIGCPFHHLPILRPVCVPARCGTGWIQIPARRYEPLEGAADRWADYFCVLFSRYIWPCIPFDVTRNPNTPPTPNFNFNSAY
ncbi:hypothetical protein C8R47DRAFT_744609 [Mycena vitilis]|nr:hypothetical protein C8R47DRAFT_744609 [Mycena vitilis]